jgi:hypothetical protein
MTPSVHRIADPVLRSLDPRVRRGVLRRIDAMERELAFLAEREDDNVKFIRSRGWSDERLQVLFVLNSVYQQVLGPIQAAAKEGPEGLGSTIPVRHGTASFSRKTAGSVQIAMKDFLVMVDALKLQRRWLHSNTCGDVVFAVASFERAMD